jgi:hypothetical protein
MEARNDLQSLLQDSQAADIGAARDAVEPRGARQPTPPYLTL